MATKGGIKSDKIAIVGSGLIGQNWSMIFAGAGYHVSVFDVDPNQLIRAQKHINETVYAYKEKGYLRGTLSPEDQISLISTTSSLKECLEGVIYIQECVPENLELKKRVFGEIDEIVGENTIIASSTSCITPSSITEGFKHRHNMVVAHPINPPYFVPLVEIVPAPWTSEDTVTKTRRLMEEIGQSPISLRRECPGFALNRIQYAAINECWNMYKSGLLSAEDIDKVVTEGLGMRYAFIGVLETMHLNADGIVDYCNRYAEGAVHVQKETALPPPVLYDVPTAQQIQDEFSSSIPLDKVQDRRKWRDSRLAALSKLKRQLNQDAK